jgi:sugar lactone lactonase YvrE
LSSAHIGLNSSWTQNGVTVAGGNGVGAGSNQLNRPAGLFVDENATVYIADYRNQRIMEWKDGATSGQVIAGGNGYGKRSDQLYNPTDMIVNNESVFICDYSNLRVVRWPRRGGASGETIISDVYPDGLTMDDKGFLYISDRSKNEVRRWRVGENTGTLVAGGHGQGDRFDQLNNPSNIFVDRDHSVYVSDLNNHRVMKWMKGAKEGIVVAGGRGGQGNGLTQLSSPRGVVVDQLGTVYIADSYNHRIMRWFKGATQGSIIVDGNGAGESNQLNYPQGLSFDRHGNLYVVDSINNRVQRFNMNRS